MITIENQKKTLRKEMLIQRAKMDVNDKKAYDLWICEELEHLILKKKCNVIHAYLPMGKEIDITPLLTNLLEKKITIVAPKTLPKRKLENRILSSLETIEKGVFGTTHPANPTEYKASFDLIIVSGLAFDDEHYRLGYGGGYYDNFLVNHPDAYKIGIFYPFQQVAKVPIESHDFKLNEILYKNKIEG